MSSEELKVLPVIDLAIHQTSTWVVMNAARERGYYSTTSDSWSSDEDTLKQVVSKLKGGVLYEDLRAESYEIVLAESKTVYTISQARREVNVSVYAKTLETAHRKLESIRKLIPQAERKSKLLDVTFWYSTPHGPRSYDRQLQAPSWVEIEANYATDTRERLAKLQTVELGESSGKLLLWQGEPGTGKTFALRALAEEWAEWCRVHYVLDPERFFTEGDYLLTVILGSDGPQQYPEQSGKKPPWRLIVLEDAGEMLAKDAKLQVGQGLARLLNLCDGLLGQGLRVLVLITTNEQVGSLHAAVSRPGRCLSQISFERFDVKSANAWLKAHDCEVEVMKQSSLADLYAVVSGQDVVTNRAVGYLPSFAKVG